MPYSPLEEIKNLFNRYNLRPSKGLGQNFLVDPEAVNKIMESANVSPQDNIIEIGPGTGILTKELAKKSKSVIAIEKDSSMIEVLKNELKEFGNIKILHEDALKIPLNELLTKRCKLISNLPYYITAPAIRRFLEAENPPELISLILQKEVAERIIAKPPKTNLLAVSIQFYAEPKIVSFIPKESFWPKPKVDSAIILITPKINFDKKLFDIEGFFRIVKAGFSQPRKQLLNNISKSFNLNKETASKILTKERIDPKRRAGTVTIDEWIKLAKTLSSIL